MAAHLSRNQPISSEEMLLERITTLHSQVKGRIEELKTLLSSNNTSTGPSISLSENFETSLSSLRSSVSTIIVRIQQSHTAEACNELEGPISASTIQS